MRLKLEIGPGYSKLDKGYAFNPHYCPGPDVIYLDVNPPDYKCVCENWVVGDAHHLPFRNESIDEIFAAHVIEHLPNPLLFLKECARVLKRGGMVTIVTPNFLSRNAYLDPDHKHVFNPVKLWRLVKAAGLRPHFPSMNLASLLPLWFRRLIKPVLLLFCDNLTIVGEKP